MHFEHLGRNAVPSIELGRWTGGRPRRHIINSDYYSGDDDYRIIYVGHQYERRRQRWCVQVFYASMVLPYTIY